ncbi:MAG: 30S ribosomal protein S2 [Planctomycetota bacterium]
MASELVREMLDAGIHFGHHASRWNPKMKPFIHGKRNAIHIVDIRETLRGILRAQAFLSRVVSSGHDVLFVGTKRQARDIIQQQAERCGMHSVTERWLGGTLTNFRTIRARLQRLDELENLMAGPTWESGFSKKMKSTLTREVEKIRRNLSGIRKMTRAPGALVVVDVRKEVNALREAQSLGIPTVCLIDTDSDPDFASIPIPGNDDSMRAISLVITKLADAVEEGKRSRPEPAPEMRGGGEGGESRGPRRRGGRGREREEAPDSAAVVANAGESEGAAGATA